MYKYEYMITFINEGNTGRDLITTNEMINSIEDIFKIENKLTNVIGKQTIITNFILLREYYEYEDFRDKNFTQVKVKIVDINSNFNIGDIFYAIKDNNENMYGIIKNTKDVVMYDLIETCNKNNSPVFGNYIEWIDDSYVEEI